MPNGLAALLEPVEERVPSSSVNIGLGHGYYLRSAKQRSNKKQK